MSRKNRIHSTEEISYVAKWRRDHPEEHRAWYTAKRAEVIARLRKFVNDYKQEHGCVVCGEHDHRVLDFHHRDAALKSGSISRMLADRVAEPRLLAEMEKCDVMCRNCHARLHYEEMHQDGLY